MIDEAAGQDCTGLFCTPQQALKPQQPHPTLPCRLRHGLGPHHLVADVGDPPSESPWGGLRPLRRRELADGLHPDPVLPPGCGGYCPGMVSTVSPQTLSAPAHICFLSCFPGSLWPRSALPILRCHLCWEHLIHRLLRSRNQRQVPGTDRGLLQDRPEVIHEVGAVVCQPCQATSPHARGQQRRQLCCWRWRLELSAKATGEEQAAMICNNFTFSSHHPTLPVALWATR